MTIPKTDVSTLSLLIENGTFEAALPCNLSDDVLMQIARDLRLFEISSTIDDSVDPPLSGPLYLYSQLLLGQAAKLVGKEKVGLDLDRLGRWMKTYLHYIEREVVSRAVKLKYPPDTDDLIAEIQKEILAIK